MLGTIAAVLVRDEIETRRQRAEPIVFPDLPDAAPRAPRPEPRPPAPRPAAPPPAPPADPAAPVEPRPVPRLTAADVRGFTHVRHQGLACVACHVMDERHGGMGVRTRSDCMECHHVTQAPAVGCGPCHADAALAGRRPLAVVMQVSAWPAPRSRDLPFDHEAHAGVACLDCHVRPPGFEVDRSCTSCHESHHQARSDCLACHRPGPEDAHDRNAHLTCAGSGCHDALPIPTPALREGRNPCLVCHQELRDHEPGRACVSCHLLPPHRGP